MDTAGLVLLVTAGYLCGAIPFGFLVGRAAGVDIRRLGSGNIGATNILRNLGPKPAALTLSLDVLKGLAPVLAARSVPGSAGAWVLGAGLAAIAGHTFPVFLRFRGGKGVATAFGVLIGLSPPAALATVLAWAAVYLFTGVVSKASLAAAACLPLLLLRFSGGDPWPVAFGIAAAILVAVTHRGNIRRIIRGEEPVTRLWKR